MLRSVDLVIHNDLSEIAVVRDALDQVGKRVRRACTRIDAFASGA